MYLIIDDEEYNILLEGGFISLLNSETHYLNLFSYKSNEIIEINTNLINKNEEEVGDNSTEEVKEVIIKKTIKNSDSYLESLENKKQKTKEPSKIKDEYSDKEDKDHPLYSSFINFKNLFPVTDKCFDFIASRTLRTDKYFSENNIKRSKAFDNYKRIINELEISSEELLQVMTYEVHWRKAVTRKLKNDNKLKYMSGLMPWLNDSENVLTMQSMMKEDVTDYSELDNPSSLDIFTDL
jgi:hypothetical protein